MLVRGSPHHLVLFGRLGFIYKSGRKPISRKQPHGWLALSVVGSHGASNNEVRVASVIRDGNGDLIFAFCKYYERCRDAFKTEVLAFRESFGVSLLCTTHSLVIQTDRATLARALKSKGINKTYLDHLVNEIKAPQKTLMRSRR